MDCPYCGGEMAEGCVTAGMRNRDNTYWRPKTEGIRDWFARRWSGAILLAEGEFGGAEAWYCPRCGKIIVNGPVREEER